MGNELGSEVVMEYGNNRDEMAVEHKGQAPNLETLDTVVCTMDDSRDLPLHDAVPSALETCAIPAIPLLS